VPVLGYDYPILGAFWTMLMLFLWIAWIMILFQVIADVFRSDDMGGVAKALWLLVVIALPLFGVLVYLVARGNSMRQRHYEDAKAADAAFRSYVQEAASSPSPADELTKLVDLRAQGVLTDAEFEQQKAKLLV
jgi:hypothetical protein